MFCVGKVNFVEILLRTALLEFPRSTTILGAQNFTELARDPAVVTVNEINSV